MRALEDLVNWLSDLDWGWWPLLRHRPRTDEDIDDQVLFKITPVFGGALAASLSLLVLGFSELPWEAVLAVIPASWPFFFWAYKYTFALAWNRRAERLRRHRHSWYS